MKNNIAKVVSFLCCIIFSFNILAQIKIGAKMGLNLNDVQTEYKNNDEEPSTKIRIGYLLGIPVEVEVSDKLSLQSGLIFSIKGYSDDIEDDALEGETIEGYSRTSINYFVVPVHGVYKLNQYQIYAGPYLGLCAGGKYKSHYTSTSTGGMITTQSETIQNYNVKPIFGEAKISDIGIGKVPISGIGYGIDFGLGYMIGETVLVNAGYSVGLSNLTPKIDFDDFDPADFKQYNRVFNLSVSYFFGSKGKE